MTALHALDTAGLLDGYRTGRFTPREAMQSVLDRIAAWESLPPDRRPGGLCFPDPEGALHAADASGARWRRGAPAGPLDGVPATIKELIASKGVPVPQGCAAFDPAPAEADSPVAARLREAGAILFARTTVPDIGMLSSGLSSLYPLTRNPWDLATNPGGSSAGAAAAAAAGYGPLHVGTDIGGSVRLPAAWCGLVGFKPSFGRIPIDPYYVGRCAGPMTRTVDDAARLMAVLTQPDPRDATALPYQQIDWQQIDWVSPGTGPAGLRVGLMLDAGCGMALDPEIAEAVTAAARSFQAAGATLVPVPPVMDDAVLDGIDRYWQARAWAELSRLPDDRRARVLPYILSWAGQGATVSGVEAIDGFGCTFTLRRRCADLFRTVDIVLSPTTPNLSFPAEYASPLDDPARPFAHIAYTLPWNMSEQPAISLNCGFSRGGTPIGLQIVTPRFADGLALQLARWFETTYGAVTTWPEPPLSCPDLT
ncbi:amidase [Nguyenibacter sp. L1]|nr:amidase [Nguyenibacter sp. L1]WRH87791.1 amidase [Nguyenibacter sp. L1]